VAILVPSTRRRDAKTATRMLNQAAFAPGGWPTDLEGQGKESGFFRCWTSGFQPTSEGRLPGHMLVDRAFGLRLGRPAPKRVDLGPRRGSSAVSAINARTHIAAPQGMQTSGKAAKRRAVVPATRRAKCAIVLMGNLASLLFIPGVLALVL
jgi:hypothetical protein